MTEPELIAYRVDLKRRIEFYSLADAAAFFKAKEIAVLQRARGYNASHFTGLKRNEKWLIFSADKSHKYVQEVLISFKSENINYR